MLRRWQAINASTSNGQKRKSAIILVTSKSKKLERVCASVMSGVPVQKLRLLCGAQRASYRYILNPVKSLLQRSKTREERAFHRIAGDGSVRAIARSGAGAR